MLTVVLVVVHRVFYSHFITSLKRYDLVVTTFLYIIIILCYVNKLNNSMSIFGGSLGQPKKMILILGIFFCQHNSTDSGFLILKQIKCIGFYILKMYLFFFRIDTSRKFKCVK
jgi:hypothetical protein